MEDLDPETEALARQLHRELNGLTRVRPRSFRLPELAGRQKSQSRKASPSGTQNNSSGNKRSKQDYSASGEDQPRQHEHPKLKRLRKEGDPGSKERSSPAVEPQVSAHAEQHPKQQQQQQLAPRSSAHCDIRAAAAQEVTGRSGRGGSGSGARARFGAVALKAAADARTKAQHVDTNALPSRVKCFYAGLRWGLTLAPETLSSRQLLAQSLTTAFSVDGVHCGRGDHLHVVFLDKDGKTSEFPPHTEAGWSTAARYACRMYVRLR